MVQVGGIGGERLRSLIERIERLMEERAALNNDIREVYAEGKAAGFDVKIMRQLIRLRQMEATGTTQKALTGDTGRTERTSDTCEKTSLHRACGSLSDCHWFWPRSNSTNCKP